MDEPMLPLARWVTEWVDRLQAARSGSLDPFTQAIGHAGERAQDALAGLPPAVAILAFGLIGWWRRGWSLGAFCAAAVAFIYALGFGEPLMVTLAQVTVATLLTVIVGLPIGILCGTSRRAAALARPLLDFMQTMPAFVYLIPAAMTFGLGLLPALLSTVVFALPVIVRLAALGIREVDRSVAEAAATLGARPWQVLLRVKLPAARPAIMAGVSQTIMMALSMVIIASMVGAGGLGNAVLSAIQRLDVGQGVASGLCVVLLAMVVDRLAETFATVPAARAEVRA